MGGNDCVGLRVEIKSAWWMVNDKEEVCGLREDCDND